MDMAAIHNMYKEDKKAELAPDFDCLFHTQTLNF